MRACVCVQIEICSDLSRLLISPAIIAIDTVRAFHLGPKYVVEVDIVLPENMPLREAHDIGESLQIKLEELEQVERAFVHLDYEYMHKPEHKAFDN